MKVKNQVKTKETIMLDQRNRNKLSEKIVNVEQLKDTFEVQKWLKDDP